MVENFALIGESLTHSFSKKYFENKFLVEKITNSKYDLIEIELKDLFNSYIKLKKNYKGLNVTIPYKTKIIEYLDFISEEALDIRAVNCIKVHEGLTYGFNTDIEGFRSLYNFDSLAEKKVLLIGNGGSAKMIKYFFGIYYSSEVTICNRNSDLDFNGLKDLNLNIFNIIINSTPIGMFPNGDEEIPIDYSQLNKNHICIDLIYNPLETIFLKKSAIKGAQTINGFKMLVVQAEKSYEIWTNQIISLQKSINFVKLIK